MLTGCASPGSQGAASVAAEYPIEARWLADLVSDEEDRKLLSAALATILED